MGKRADWAFLAPAMLIALVLRWHGLGGESAWADEYCSIVIDPSMTLREFFAVHRFRNPDHIPFYYLFVYWWSQVFGPSDYGVRLVSVFLSILTVPFVYLCGRECGGKTGGRIATALYCISPFFIYHAQGARPYALVVLMSVVSAWSLMHAVRGPNSLWWAINFVANLLIVYGHLSGAFFLAAEGLFLLLVYRTRLLPVITWSALHLAALVPPLLWMMVPPQDPWYQMPELWSTLVNWFGDDVAHWNIELVFGNPDWSSRYPQFWNWCLANQFRFGAALMLFFALMTIWAVAILARKFWSALRTSELVPNPTLALAFMVFIAFVPAALLLAVSFLKEPMPMPRYAVYANIGLYCIVGACLASLRSVGLRAILLCVVAVLYGYQSVVTFQATARTEWNQLAAWMREDGTGDDVALIGSHTDPWFDIDLALAMIFRHSLLPDETPVFCSNTQREMVNDSVRAANYLSAHGEASVWLVLFQVYDKRPLDELESALHASGFSVDRRNYMAMEGLTAFHLTLPLGKRAQANTDGLPLLKLDDTEELLRSWGLPEKDPVRLEAIHENLSRFFDAPPPPPVGAMALAYLSQSVGAVDAELALELAEVAIDTQPDLATAHFARGVALLQLGKNDNAIAAFEACKEAPADESTALIEDLLDSLIRGDHDAAASHVVRIEKLGAPLYTGLKDVLGIPHRLDDYLVAHPVEVDSANP